MLFYGKFYADKDIRNVKQDKGIIKKNKMEIMKQIFLLKELIGCVE